MSVCFCPFLYIFLNFCLFLSVSLGFCQFQSKFLFKVVLNISAFVLDMTVLVLNKNGLVLSVTKIVLNITGFDFFSANGSGITMFPGLVFLCVELHGHIFGYLSHIK